MEIGTSHGHTTRILSFLFKEVTTFDHSDNNIRLAKETNNDRTNVIYGVKDVYRENWNVSNMDVIFIDCDHTYAGVMKDIDNALKVINSNGIIFFDDYGLISDVHKAVDDCIANKKFEIVKFIGEPAGSDPRPGKILQDWEGVICRVI